MSDTSGSATVAGESVPPPRLRVTAWSIQHRQLLLLLMILVPALGIVLLSGVREREGGDRERRRSGRSCWRRGWPPSMSRSPAAHPRAAEHAGANSPSCSGLDLPACNALFRELNEQNPPLLHDSR